MRFARLSESLSCGASGLIGFSAPSTTLHILPFLPNAYQSSDRGLLTDALRLSRGWLVLEVFASLAVQGDLTLPRLSSHSLSLLSRVQQLWRHLGASLSGMLFQLPSLRFLPLRRFPDHGQLHNSRDYQASGYGTSSAFLTLSRFCSAHNLPALFHAGPVLEVAPFKVVTHSRSCARSHVPLPSCGFQDLLAADSAHPVMSAVQEGSRSHETS
jgi:hypothetical protein